MSSDQYSDDARAELGPIQGFFRSLGNLLATLVGIAHTRLELLSTEIQQEVHRAAQILVWTLVALLAAGIGLFLAALVTIFVFWDSHRIVASVAVTIAFFVIAGVAGVVVRAKVRSRPRLLDATLNELAKDRESLEARPP